MLQSATKRKYGREQAGDALHSFALHPGESAIGEHLPHDHFWICFGSVLQGGHAGVEIATSAASAHEKLLQRYDLLDDESRLVASRCLRSSSLLQGLVIDDSLAASVEERSTYNSDSKAAACYTKSQQAYRDADLLGSPSKDETGGNEGKLVGAFFNSSGRALSRKVCTVGAPAVKRIALSYITLTLSSLACTSDVLH